MQALFHFRKIVPKAFADLNGIGLKTSGILTSCSTRKSCKPSKEGVKLDNSNNCHRKFCVAGFPTFYGINNKNELLSQGNYREFDSTIFNC